MAEGTAVTTDAKPFGVVATFAIGTIALLAGQLSGIAALSAWYGLDLTQVGALSQDGGAIVVFIFVSAPVQVAILALAASYKGNVAEYLGYKLPRRRETVIAIAVLVALIAAGDAVSWLAGRHIVDRFQSEIYEAARSANLLPLLLVAIVVFIPVGEESLFRGFLFRGWLRSPRSPWPIIIVTAGIFGVIHVQYDWFLIVQVFVFGVFFGWIRWVTGSTFLTMLLHGLVNLEGMIETMLTTGN